MDSKAFVQQLENELKGDREEHQVLVREFFSKNPSKEELKSWLEQRCWREAWAAIHLAEALIKHYKEMDRELVKLVAKQVWDEWRHFDMVGTHIEELTGSKLDAGSIRPLPEWENVFNPILEYSKTDIISMFAVLQFYGEAQALAAAKAILKVAPSNLKHTYAVIERDENYHVNIGRIALQKYCTDPAVQQRVQGVIAEMRKLHASARRRQP